MCRRMHSVVDVTHWSTLGLKKHGKIMEAARGNRALGCVVAPQLVNADLMGKEVYFLGLTRDPKLVFEKFGYDDSTVFVAEFGEFISG